MTIQDLTKTKVSETQKRVRRYQTRNAEREVKPIRGGSGRIVSRVPYFADILYSGGRGTLGASHRAIDDVNRPKINATIRQEEAYCPQTIDRISAWSRHTRRNERENCRAVDDFRKAYKSASIIEEPL